MRNIVMVIFILFISHVKSDNEIANALSISNRIKVVVLDTGISHAQSIADYSCIGQHKTFAGGSIYDSDGHGTNIISIISKSIEPKTHCIVSYRVFNKNNVFKTDSQAIVDALQYANTDDQIKYVNMSLGGPVPLLEEKKAIEILLARGVTLSVAAGNEGNNLNFNCNYFPACYAKELRFKNFFVVKSKGQGTNYGDVITDEFSGIKIGTPTMSGTSQASAQKMARLLKDVVLYSNRRADDRLQRAN